MAEHNAVVGIYTTHTEAEAAVKALQRTGFDMQDTRQHIAAVAQATL